MNTWFLTSNFGYWTSDSRRLILLTARWVPDVMFFFPTRRVPTFNVTYCTSGSRHLDTAFYHHWTSTSQLIVDIILLCEVCVLQRYDTMIFTCAQKLTYSQLNLPHGTKQKRIMKKLKIKTEMLRRNGPVIKPWSQSWGRKGVYGRKDLWKRQVFSRQWKTEGVIRYTSYVSLRYTKVFFFCTYS